MENMKRQSSSSFTETLFGPKDVGTVSSSGHFGSVFGPFSSTQTRNDRKETNPICQTETAGPSYMSSSIYYGGRDVYPPTSHDNTCSQRTYKKGGVDEDPNGTSASRGNWWQGSLYY